MIQQRLRHAVSMAVLLVSMLLPLTAVGTAEAEAKVKAPSNPTKLIRDDCRLWFNYTPGRRMDKTPGHFLNLSRKTNTGKTRRVNYRYNYDGTYAVVLTLGKQGQWGFINRSCLGTPPNPHLVKGRVPEHLPRGAKKHIRYVCEADSLYVRDAQQRVIGRLYHGERFIQYGKSHPMKKAKGRVSVGVAYGHVNKAGRVDTFGTRVLSSKPCAATTAAQTAATAATPPPTASATSAAPAAPMQMAAASCQYKVLWPTAGVYERPSNTSGLLKTKHAGDIVGGYCDWTVYNATEGKTYLAVATQSAEDGIGWMRQDALAKM